MTGSEQNNELPLREEKIAVFPIKSNPPHMGNLLELYHASTKYDKIYVAIYKNVTVLPVKIVIDVLGRILHRFTDMFEIVETPYDFSNISSLPPEFKKLGVKYIITSSDKIYANFAGKGYPFLERIPRARGYYDEYQQIAYARGFILDQIKGQFK